MAPADKPVANLFEAEAEILAALHALAATFPADRPLLIGSSIEVVGTRNIASLVPGVYVAPAAPGEVREVGDSIEETQQWYVTCAVRSIGGQPGESQTHAALGELAIAALHAVNRVEGLIYTGRDEIQYREGHAELTLTFACERAFDPEREDASLSDFLRFDAQWDLAEPDGQAEARDRVTLPGPAGEGGT